MALKDEKKDPQPTRTPSPVKSAIHKERPREDREFTGTSFSVTGIRSATLHSTFTKVVLGLLILIFAVGFGISTLQPGATNRNDQGRIASGPDPIAQVGNESISRAKFVNLYGRQLDFRQRFGQSSGVTDELSTQQTTLQMLTDDAAQYEEAKRRGITATDADIEEKIKKDIADRIKQEQGENPAAFRRIIERKYASQQAYEDEVRKSIDTPEYREQLAHSLVVEKLEKKIKDSVKVTEDDYKRSVTKLKLRQIVIRPKLPEAGAKDFAAQQEKMAGEAKERAERMMAQLKTAPTAQNFAAIAQKESDDTPTKTKGGDLGWKLPAELGVSSAIRDALSNAKENLVGPLQDDVVKDWYIFLIEDRKFDPPKDYAKKKDELFKSFKEQRANQVWEDEKQKIIKAATVQIYDPALAAYKIQMQDMMKASPQQRSALQQEAIKKYQEALASASGTQAAAINYQLATLYRELQQPGKATEALQAAVSQDEKDPTLRVELATSLMVAKRNDDALKQLQKASQLLDTKPPSQPSMFGGNPDDQMRLRIASEYEILKRVDLATAERKKVKPPSSPGGGMGGGMGGLQIR